jgi:hypothetical protein
VLANSPTKRRRGGQPGNQNAKGNRGNSKPSRNFGNRGGRGAPIGNQNACKPPCSPDAVLLRDYQHNPAALEWIKANLSALRDAAFTDDDRRDQAIYDCYRGLTPEALALSGQEYRLNLFSVLSVETPEDEELAA